MEQRAPIYEWTDKRGLVVRIPAEAKPPIPARITRRRSWRRLEADLFDMALLAVGGFGLGFFLGVFALI